MAFKLNNTDMLGLNTLEQIALERLFRFVEEAYRVDPLTFPFIPQQYLQMFDTVKAKDVVQALRWVWTNQNIEETPPEELLLPQHDKRYVLGSLDRLDNYLRGGDVVFPQDLFNGYATSRYSAQVLDSMFADAAGTVPATVDNVVMLQKDLVSNKHRSNSNSATAPILRRRNDGVYYLDFTGNKQLTVVDNKDGFKYLHDGTGGSIFAMITWPQSAVASNYIQTCTGTTGSGIQVIKSASNQNLTVAVNRAVSGQSAISAVVARFALSSAPRMLRFSFKHEGTASDGRISADSGRTRVDVGILGSGANTPSTANHTSDLHVSTTFNGHEYELVLTARVLTDEADVESMWKYMRQWDYRVPSIDGLSLLLVGQSNTSGRGYVTTPLPEEILEGVYSFTKANEFRIAAAPVHSIENRIVPTSPDEASLSAPAAGWALRLGKKLQQDSNKDVLLVPTAVGGTSMAQWNTPITVNNESTLFGAAAIRFARARVKGGTPVICLWGHEADVASAIPDYVNGGVGSTYVGAMTSLINNFRQYITNAPVVLFQLSSHNTLDTAEKHAAAAEAQRQIAATLPEVYLVPTHDVQRNPGTDSIHVAAEGHLVAGDRAALTIREHILGEAVDGTGPQLADALVSGSVVTVTFDRPVNSSGTNYGDLFRVYGGGVEATVTSAVRNADTTKIDITCSAALTLPVTVTYGYKAGFNASPRTDFVKGATNFPAPLFGPVVCLGPELVTDETISVTNATGGAVYTTDAVNRSITITQPGSSTSYPRILLVPGLTVGQTYKVVGRINPGQAGLSTPTAVRLATSGTANTVPFDSSTGIFEGTVIAAANMLEVLVDGTKAGTITIDELSIRRVL